VGDFTAISQKQMLANFQAINTTFLIDHVALTAVEDVGKHNALTLRPQNSDPTTAADQSAIYNKLVSGLPQLFFRPSSNQTPIQLSNPNLNTPQTFAPGSTQSSFLAGPFTIYMGYIIGCANGQVVSLTPSSTLLYVGLSTHLLGNVSVGLASTSAAVGITANQFTVSYNATQITTNPLIYYMAIGQ
jgi:hypothetical protein